MDIKLHEFGPTRSVRCRWALQEAGLEFEAIETPPSSWKTQMHKDLHPLGKLPVLVVDGKALFESAAICTYIADLVPERKLIAPAGTWARALHDQWTYFGVTELEAYTWSSFRNTNILPEAEQVPAIIPQNDKAFKAAAVALEGALATADYLVDNRFSITDVIMGYTINSANRQGLIDGMPKLQAYRERLLARPNCCLIP